MSAGLLAAVGLLAGVLIGVVLLRRSALARAEALFLVWQADESRDIGVAAAAGARLGIKQDLSAAAGLPFPAADARWLGDPLPIVVFDGDSEVKAGTAEDLRVVRFVTIPGHPCPDADLVAECVADGRVRWETLRLAADG